MFDSTFANLMREFFELLILNFIAFQIHWQDRERLSTSFPRRNSTDQSASVIL